MNKRATELKRELERLFEAKNQLLASATQPMDFIITGDDRKAFDEVQTTIMEALAGNFKDGVSYSVPDASFSVALRRVLSYRPFSTFDGWHVAPDITEKDLLAAEANIRAGKIAALKGLRDKKRTMDFEMPLSSPGLGEYQMVLNNFRYLLVVLAHQAKRYASFPSARAFLSAASLVGRRSKMTPPCFKEEEIEQVVALLEEGVDELQIASDYAELEPWERFSAREGKLFFESLPADQQSGKAAKG